MKPSITFAAALCCTFVSLVAFAVPRNVTGTLRYDEFAHDDENNEAGTGNVRNHPVTVSVVGGATLGTVDTDASGFYALYDVDVPVSGTLRVSFGSQNYAGEIVGSTTWSSDMAIPGGSGPIDFSPAPFTKANNGKKLNALNALAAARAYADARRDDLDEIPLASNPNHVKLHYPTPGTPADHAHYCTASSSFCSGPNVIELPDVMAWQDGVITHEYAHHLQYYVSGPPMAMASMGDPCTQEVHIQAWHEGFPQYFAGAVLGGAANASLWYGVGFWFDMENLLCPVSNPPAGASTFEYVWLTLWDMHDGISVADDKMNGGTVHPSGTLKDMVFEVFDKELDVGLTPDIVRFHDAVNARDPYYGIHADLDYTYAKHKLIGGGKVHSLPDYSNLWVFWSPSSTYTGSWSTMYIEVGNNTNYNYPNEDLAIRIYVGATELDYFTIGSSFSSALFSRSVYFPTTLGPGTKSVKIKVDHPDDFAEESESNNVITTSVTLNTWCGDGWCAQGEGCKSCFEDCGFCGFK